MLWFYDSKDLMTELPKNDFVFLAGPTDRRSPTRWRIEFLKRIPNREKYHFFIPEYYIRKYCDAAETVPNLMFKKEEVIEIERSLLRKAYKIIFWVDRRLQQGMPALTTNIEFGNFYSPVKCICGSPESADKVLYMKYVWEKECGQKWYNDMDELISHLMKYLEQLKNG